MIEFGSDFDQSAAPPFIRHLWESRAGALHIMVSLASVGEQGPEYGSKDPAVDALLGRCRPVMADASCTYEIIFEDYVLFQTCSRPCARWDERIGTGKYFAVFSQSALLAELPQLALCQKTWDGIPLPNKQYTHYGILAQERVVDIITHKEPTIIKRNMVLKEKLDSRKRRFVISRAGAKDRFIRHTL